jgi:uncharacterized membrane protein
MKNIEEKLNKIALVITKAVGSMWCAIIFTILALVSLPTAIHGGIGTIISWIAQTFLQLVLLSIIMVGQSLQSKQDEQTAQDHYETSLRHEEKIDIIDENVDKLVALLTPKE